MNKDIIEAGKAENEKLHELIEIHDVDERSRDLEEKIAFHEKDEENQKAIEEMEQMMEYDYCDIDDNYEDPFFFNDWPDPIKTCEEMKSQRIFDETIDWKAECFIYGYEGGLYKEDKTYEEIYYENFHYEEPDFSEEIEKPSPEDQYIDPNDIDFSNMEPENPYEGLDEDFDEQINTRNYDEKLNESIREKIQILLETHNVEGMMRDLEEQVKNLFEDRLKD